MVPISDWSPDLPAVGSILRVRTRDDVGSEIGTFTADTRPTGDQVLELIAQTAADVAQEVGEDLPSGAWAAAGMTTAYGAAAALELSYFTNQVNQGTSPYPQLKQVYDERLARLVRLVTSLGGDVHGREPGDLEPSGYFPTPGVFMPYGPLYINYRTRW